MTAGELFDVDAFRALGHRVLVVQQIQQPTLVLGSTQDGTTLDADALARRGVGVVRRRSGGGAVLLEPGRSVWVDTWVPYGDPLWHNDVGRSAGWVGAWWASALGLDASAVHRGAPVESRWARSVCFAGVGPGEVVTAGRKVVGVAQWRGREGALSHSFAYLDVDWAVLVELLGLGAGRAEAASELAATTGTLRHLGVADPGPFVEALVDHLPDRLSWELRRRAA